MSKNAKLSVPLEIHEVLDNYVYGLRDPRTKKLFYIGKGQGDRLIQHVKQSDGNPEAESLKLARIQEIEAAGLQVEHLFIRFGVSADMAFAIEQATIDALEANGDTLTNLVKGHNSIDFGYSSLEDVIERFAAEPTPAIAVPLIMLKINKLYLKGQSDQATYENSRAHWKVAKDTRETAKLAVAISFGIVRGVYWIDEWMPSSNPDLPDRWEFNGRQAHEYGHLIGTSSKEAFSKYNANPVRVLLSGYSPEPKFSQGFIDRMSDSTGLRIIKKDKG